MKLNAIIGTVAIANSFVVFASECSKEQLRNSMYVFNSDARGDCGSDIAGLFAYGGQTPSGYLCSRCVETVEYAAKYFPDCTINGRTYSNMSEAISQHCEREYNFTESLNSGSMSVGDSECSPSEQTEITNLRSDPAMQQVCGDYDTTENVTKVCTSYCSAYIKDKYVPELPDCSIEGVDVKAWAKIKAMYCEPLPDTAGSLTTSSVLALAGLAVAALVVA